jgi:hypothetical protein
MILRYWFVCDKLVTSKVSTISTKQSTADKISSNKIGSADNHDARTVQLKTSLLRVCCLLLASVGVSWSALNHVLLCDKP